MPNLGALQFWNTGLGGTIPQSWFAPGAWPKMRYLQLLNYSGITGKPLVMVAAHSASSTQQAHTSDSLTGYLSCELCASLRQALPITHDMLAQILSSAAAMPACLQSQAQTGKCHAGTLPALAQGSLPSLKLLDFEGANLHGSLPQVVGSGSIETMTLSNLGLSGCAAHLLTQCLHSAPLHTYALQSGHDTQDTEKHPAA